MVSLVWNAEDAKKAYMAEAREETLIENIRVLMEKLKLSAGAARIFSKFRPKCRKNSRRSFEKIFACR